MNQRYVGDIVSELSIALVQPCMLYNTDASGASPKGLFAKCACLALMRKRSKPKTMAPCAGCLGLYNARCPAPASLANPLRYMDDCARAGAIRLQSRIPNTFFAHAAPRIQSHARIIADHRSHTPGTGGQTKAICTN